VLSAVINLNKLNRESLHNNERPISFLAYQQAEMNRDKAKRRKPFKPEEFYYYADQSLMNLPEPKYGAAALALIEQRLFPHWALFTYPDLKARASDAMPPEFLCLQCEDAIVLAPSIEGRVLSGMLIASKTASEKTRKMASPCGKEFTVRLPIIAGKFEANEEAELHILS